MERQARPTVARGRCPGRALVRRRPRARVRVRPPRPPAPRRRRCRPSRRSGRGSCPSGVAVRTSCGGRRGAAPPPDTTTGALGVGSPSRSPRPPHHDEPRRYDDDRDPYDDRQDDARRRDPVVGPGPADERRPRPPPGPRRPSRRRARDQDHVSWYPPDRVGGRGPARRPTSTATYADSVRAAVATPRVKHARLRGPRRWRGRRCSHRGASGAPSWATSRGTAASTTAR